MSPAEGVDRTQRAHKKNMNRQSKAKTTRCERSLCYGSLYPHLEGRKLWTEHLVTGEEFTFVRKRRLAAMCVSLWC